MWTCYLLCFSPVCCIVWAICLKACVFWEVSPPPGGPCSALSAPVISYCTHSPFVDFTCKSHVLFSPLSSGYTSRFLSMAWIKDVKLKIRKQKMEELKKRYWKSDIFALSVLLSLSLPADVILVSEMMYGIAYQTIRIDMFAHCLKSFDSDLYPYSQ